jgi:hypothetical protein
MDGTQFPIAFTATHTVIRVPPALGTLCDTNLFSLRTLDKFSKNLHLHLHLHG